MLRVRLKIESRMDLASSQLAGFFNLPWLALYLVQDRYEISVCEWEKKISSPQTNYFPRFDFLISVLYFDSFPSHSAWNSPLTHLSFGSCISQGSPEIQNQEDLYIYKKRDSHEYGGCLVPRSTVSKLETHESQWYSSSLQKTKEPMFQFKSWVRNRPMSQSSSWAEGVPSYFWESQTLCSSQGFNWLDKAHPHLGEQTALLQSTNSNVNLNQKHPHRDTQNNVWPNVWALRGPVHWTHKTDKSFLSSPQVLLFLWRGGLDAVRVLTGKRGTLKRG